MIACFMVMTIHAAEPFYLGGSDPNITHIANRWDMLWITVTECLCRVCVPLFAMASSYLLFPVSRPTGEFLRRRLLRVALPFAVGYQQPLMGFNAHRWEKTIEDLRLEAAQKQLDAEAKPAAAPVAKPAPVPTPVAKPAAPVAKPAAPAPATKPAK